MKFRRDIPVARIHGMLAMACSLTNAGIALAQPAPLPATDEPAPAAAAQAPTSAAGTPVAPVDSGGDVSPDTAPAAAPEAKSAEFARLNALEQKLDAQASRIDELEGTISAFNEQLAASDTEGSEDRRLAAWGFFDVTFGRMIYDHSNAAYAVATPNHWTFMNNGINVYLKSEMTKTLSAMVETRLTYTPVGNVTQYPTDVYINGTLAQTVGTYTRQNAASRLPYSYFMYRQHGVFIERAHLDWKPKDWFGIRLGRYLTPFGIWNEDHGSPVVLGVDMPNIINFALVPTHQMGVQFFGNRLLSDKLNLEYAVTLSNGRGPIDEYQDLDNNKAVGLRAKFIYSTDDLLLRLGGYVYRGRYTDSEQRSTLALTPAMSLDRSQAVPWGSTSKDISSYQETVGTLDAMIQFKGLKVMGEMARRQVLYNVAPPMDPQAALLKGIPFGAQVHAASYNGIAYYVIAGYEIDLGDSLAHVKVTPYLGADHLSPDQTMPYLDMNQYRLGLNVKPSPYITNKLEAMRVVPKSAETSSQAWMVVAQTAVSF